MPLVGGFVFPHGAITLDPDTRDLTKEPAYLPTTKENCLKLHEAMMNQARALLALKPDVVIMTTPHGLRLQNNYTFFGNDKAFGAATWDGKWEDFAAEINLDSHVTTELLDTLSTAGNAVDRLLLGSPSDDKLPLRWAEAIPWWFITEASKETGSPLPSTVLMSVRSVDSTHRGDLIPELLKLGGGIWTYIKASLTDKRVVIVTSCDLAHYHSKDPTSPYEFNEDAVPFDNFCVAWSKIDIDRAQASSPESESNKQLLTNAGDLVNHIGSCGYPGLVLMQGILTSCAGDQDTTQAKDFRSFFLDYSWPTYYGMIVNSFIAIGT